MKNDGWLEGCDVAIRHGYDFLSVSCFSFVFGLLKSGNAVFDSLCLNRREFPSIPDPRTLKNQQSSSASWESHPFLKNRQIPLSFQHPLFKIEKKGRKKERKSHWKRERSSKNLRKSTSLRRKIVDHLIYPNGWKTLGFSWIFNMNLIENDSGSHLITQVVQ